MGTNVSTNYITCPVDDNKTLAIKLPFLVMIIKNVSPLPRSLPTELLTKLVCVNSWRSTSPSKCRFSMTRMSVVDSELQTISLPPVSSHSSAPCQWDSMRDGIRFSSTCLISPEELTVPTILRPSGKLPFHVTTALWLFKSGCLLYVVLNRVQIHANCRIRRIYFSDRLYTEDELPPEFKLFLPVAGKPSNVWATRLSKSERYWL